MPIVEIHGEKVHIKEGSRSGAYAAEHLQNLDKSEAHNFFRTAEEKKYSHFETPKHADKKDLEHDMTLVHVGHHEYELRKRND